MYLVQKLYLLSGFEILNASAGSGKTYQLTKSYLKHVLIQPGVKRFRQVLALTFTNKAVAEMKSRILNSLYEFGNAQIDKSEHPLFQELQEELGLTYKVLESRSKLTLKLLLHNYNFFEVSTIDKFTHRVVKTFAKDLNISQNFNVELDSDLLLDDAISSLLQRLNENQKLKNVLIDFALEKIEADKSWNIVYDLKSTGKLIFNENHYKQLQRLRNTSLEDFDDLKRLLREKREHSNTKAVHLAKNALNTIYESGFEDSDFSRETLPNHFKKISNGERSIKLYSNKIEEGLINGSLLLKKVEKDGSQLFQLLLDFYLQIKSHIFDFQFYKNAYNNILPLTVLNEISKEIGTIQKENDTLHISEFNKLITKEIGNQPVPYIYERLGERFRHYFIDEFQDTSKMQWNNLVPLIGNAIETENLEGTKGSLLLVGDPKQSIYRWRGGDPEQFLGLNDNTSNPFTVPSEVKRLNTNWRSFDAVIGFNNAFFKHTSKFLNDPKHQKLYLEQSEQKTNSKVGGYVEIAFVPKGTEEVSSFYCNKVLEYIRLILDKEYGYQDICILVRKNKEGVEVAKFLTERNIPIISSEALLLANNPEVQFLVNLLRFLENPHETVFQYDLLEYLFKNKKNNHDLIVTYLGDLPEYFKRNYNYNIFQERSHTLLDILERAISVFGFEDTYGAHLVHFLDTVQDQTEKSSSGIHSFLNYWDLKKDVLAISSPPNQNAIQIMTIHKSKGLEFPFVIYPFADSNLKSRIQETKIWVPTRDSNEEEFNYLLVNTSKELQHHSKESLEAYTQENNLSELDDINVLYVALTRAIQGLFIITKLSSGENYGRLFYSYLLENDFWNEETSFFSFGNLEHNTSHQDASIDLTTIPYIYTDTIQSTKLAITSESLWDTSGYGSMQWGKEIHEVLSKIHSKVDLERALKSALQKGHFSEALTETVRKIVLSIITHPELASFYQEESSIMNEVEIMDAQGNLHRPDRLIFNDTSVTILDYKTGGRRSEHEQQLSTYATILEEQGFVVTQQILVYIGNKIEPVFI